MPLAEVVLYAFGTVVDLVDVALKVPACLGRTKKARGGRADPAGLRA